MRNSLRRLEGVRQVEVDIEDSTASIVIATAQVDTAMLTAATTNIGFPSVVNVTSK